MKTIDRRIGKLHHQFGTAAGKPQYLLAVCRAGWGLAIDQDSGFRSSVSAGFCPRARSGLVNLGQIPDGLNAEAGS
jgi:hypothetical protein